MAESNTRVLSLANSEHGQTNIILALAHELLLRGDIDVHVGSFPALKKRVDIEAYDHFIDWHHA